VILLPDDSLLAYVADVSDKGVPAALIMAALSTKIRSEARIQNDVDKLLETVNKSTYDLTAEEGFFATIALVHYWPRSGSLHLAMGGHLKPLWIVEGSASDLPAIKGITLGVMPDAVYEKKEILLSPGASLLLYTDGITEACNSDQELLGLDRLLALIKSTPGPPWGEAILDAIRHWQGDVSAGDDITLLEIWREVEKGN
jgi:serine phosphatase RsbU (regulator of sigma subunit)